MLARLHIKPAVHVCAAGSYHSTARRSGAACTERCSCTPSIATRQYLENAAGHHWLAQRIPDDRFFVSANQGRFQVCWWLMLWHSWTGNRRLLCSQPGLLLGRLVRHAYLLVLT